MLEEKISETTSAVAELARRYAEGEIVRADFISAVEKTAKKREQKAFYLGIGVSVLLLILLIGFIKIFPGMIAWKY
jgi:hypothetical protein